ncbi:MAG: hypothetical protein K0S19_1427, partial [Geminicoccaceae bacterium]|nr:hypothetical protein [Geminicoccaceae bacterium]
PSAIETAVAEAGYTATAGKSNEAGDGS